MKMIAIITYTENNDTFQAFYKRSSKGLKSLMKKVKNDYHKLLENENTEFISYKLRDSVDTDIKIYNLNGIDNLNGIVNIVSENQRNKTLFVKNSETIVKKG